MKILKGLIRPCLSYLQVDSTFYLKNEDIVTFYSTPCKEIPLLKASLKGQGPASLVYCWPA